MKKVLVLFVFALFTLTAFNSCEPDTTNGEDQELSTGHGEVGDPEEETEEEGGSN